MYPKSLVVLSGSPHKTPRCFFSQSQLEISSRLWWVEVRPALLICWHSWMLIQPQCHRFARSPLGRNKLLAICNVCWQGHRDTHTKVRPSKQAALATECLLKLSAIDQRCETQPLNLNSHRPSSLLSDRLRKFRFKHCRISLGMVPMKMG